MTTQIETFVKRRNRILTILALTYLGFQIISLTFVAEFTGWPTQLLNRLEDIGIIMFLALLIYGSYLYRRIYRKHDAAKTILEDELARHNQQRTFQFSYKVLFLFSVGVFCVAQFMEFTGEDVARMIMTIAFITPALRFAYLESQNA